MHSLLSLVTVFVCSGQIHPVRVDYLSLFLKIKCFLVTLGVPESLLLVFEVLFVTGFDGTRVWVFHKPVRASRHSGCLITSWQILDYNRTTIR